MDSQSYKTISANAQTVNKEWLVIDAEGEVLGRLASQVAKILRGKHKPSFTPHVDCGDNVIVVNADKVRLTGKKMTDKVYVRHTGYPGGQRFATPADTLKRKPQVFQHVDSCIGPCHCFPFSRVAGDLIILPGPQCCFVILEGTHCSCMLAIWDPLPIHPLHFCVYQ